MTEEEIDAEVERAFADAEFVGPYLCHVSEARYNAQADVLFIAFPEGTEMRIPRRLLEGLADAKPEDVAEIEIVGGEVLWWERLEVGHAVSDLVQGWYGSRSWCREHRLLPKAVCCGKTLSAEEKAYYAEVRGALDESGESNGR